MAGKSDYSKMKARFAEVKNRTAGGVDDDKWWKPEAPQSSSGQPITHRVRILPPPDGFNFWYLEYGVHYRLKDEAGNDVSCTCPLKTLKQRCPVCEFTKGLWKSGTEADQNLARDIGSKTRFCSNVLILGKGQEVFKAVEPKLWSYGPKVWTPLNELCVGESGEIVPIDDPDNGYNIKIVVSTTAGEVAFPNYTVMPELKPCSIPDKSVLNKLHPMHEMIRSKVKSFDEIRSILMGSGTSPEAPAPAQSREEAIADAPVPDAVTTVIEENEEEVIVATQEKSHGKAEGNPQVARPSQDELIKRARAALQKRSAQ